ncbi:uncharacterized protein [Diadema antillarum]|uniref:uncharacterized protein n=1 Tax=Diadema antillarum TaxID=105358 RepID=UPI003A83690C
MVDRVSLWHKMLKSGVDGKVFTVIKNMYAQAKSCVLVDGQHSEAFQCNVGVRQGENLSPLLFALYLNDFESFLSCRFKGLQFLFEKVCVDILDKEVNEDLFIHLYTLLYADDTLILADSAEELQLALNALHGYCIDWKLSVNTTKTKVLIFSRGKVRNFPLFSFGEDKLDVVDDFVYLGIQFNYNGSFKKAISKQVTQARKALFSMSLKVQKLKLPVDIQCELFDQLVLPILLYGCEVWGFMDLSQIEIFHRKFLKSLLCVNKFTPDCMVYVETGRIRLANTVKYRMVSFWLRIIKGSSAKYSFRFYTLQRLISQQDTTFVSKWISHIEEILNNAGLGVVWLRKGEGFSNNWILSTLKLRLSDMSKQDLMANVWSNRVCLNYRIFKTNSLFERYLVQLSKRDRISLSRFRCRSNRLPANNRRFVQSFDERDVQCPCCDRHETGDEFHYVFVCPFFEKERQLYLSNHYLVKRPCSLHMSRLFSCSHLGQLKRLVLFVRLIMSYFANLQKPEQVEYTVVKKENIVTRSGRKIKHPVILDL